MNPLNQTEEKREAVPNGVSRVGIAVLGVLLQVLWIVWAALKLTRYYAWVQLAISVLAFLLALRIYGRHTNSATKLSWIIVILTFPIFGVCLYLLFGRSGAVNIMRGRFTRTDTELQPHYATPLDRAAMPQDPALQNQIHYLQTQAHYPACRNTDVTYYGDTNAALEAQKTDLRKAQHFIFMEYHAIEDSIAWQGIEDILAERAAAGVEVCVIYDDFGCIQRLSASYPRELAGFNIKAVPYNPMRPSMDPSLNYRDHRKICVIDGQVGFTGGINLADEYINKVERFGHWKDTAVLLRGSAVRSLTRMFLQQWTLNAGSDTLDYPEEEYLTAQALPAQGYVQPYPDTPLDHFNAAENAYLHLIQRADHYVYITTPYLILDNEFVTTLKTAAESGVDVRIITPSHPDKWYVHMVSRSYYQTLIQSGVKIYEYQPGFIHAKMCLCDDEAAMVGTANLDYRSLYLHYENAVLLYHTPVLAEIKKDIEETLEKSRLITIEELRSKLRGTSALCALLKLLAPLM